MSITVDGETNLGFKINVTDPDPRVTGAYGKVGEVSLVIKPHPNGFQATARWTEAVNQTRATRQQNDTYPSVDTVNQRHPTTPSDAMS
jgi:hypothetical protein